ncbi:apolipoprotein D-like [Hyposmocoma kahamanoa]|uniref:apolipoprotein D-like n=1 Tax=Hyposmocoma kahamanoa TaxID=1477025 RepID=UPI000E6D9384|nr:apolipoprotein D-like [Hyposmocoma kahamanoa]
MILRFLGKWYEIERFPAWYEEYGSCAFKTIDWCGNWIEIEHGFIRNEIQYILHVNSTYTHGDEAVFEIKKNNIDPFGIPLSVTFTDYDNYAIVYGCKSVVLQGMKYISAWILSRNTTLPSEMLDKAKTELNSLPYASIAYLKTVSQDTQECNFYWTAHVHAEDTARQ